MTVSFWSGAAWLPGHRSDPKIAVMLPQSGPIDRRETMMKSHLTSLSRAAFLAALTSLAPAAASAQEGVFFKDLLGSLGIIDGEKDPIVYRERPPLVLPPGQRAATLPAPLPQDAAPSRNPAWPNDPDVVAAREAAIRARQPVPLRSDRLDPTQGARLSVDEIRAGRRVGGGAVQGPARANYAGREDTWVHPDELRKLDRNIPKPSDSVIAYGQEPERRYLSDPPAGLRRPASNAPIPRTSSQPVVDQNMVDEGAFARRGTIAADRVRR